MNASISHFAEGWGRHDLKFGVEIERSKTRDRYLLHQQHLLLRLRRRSPTTPTATATTSTAATTASRVFAQDSWKPNDRLTLNLGVRMDHMSGGAPDHGRRLHATPCFAPRIGFAFDLTGNHTTVLKGSYSQYYEGIFNDIYKLATPGLQGPHLLGHGGMPGLRRVGTHGRLQLPAVRPRRGEPPHPARRPTSTDDIKHPRVDEWSAGLEHQFGQNWRVSATGIYRENKNFIGNVLPDARWTPTA